MLTDKMSTILTGQVFDIVWKESFDLSFLYRY